MSAELTVAFAPGEGAMLRILGLVERRGYRIRRADMHEGLAEASLSMLVEPRDDFRQPQSLAMLVEGLHEVRKVTCHDIAGSTNA